MRLVTLAALALAWPALANAQECGPQTATFGWSQPPKVPIDDENALRPRLNSTFRLAYGGPWCPEAGQITLTNLDTGEGVPAQLRLRTPYLLVENGPEPLTLIEIDPVDDLDERADYKLVGHAQNPQLPRDANFEILFRTKNTPLDPFPDFEGIHGVDYHNGLDARCDIGLGPYVPLDDHDPACVVSSQLILNVAFQPLDRPDLAYVVYRTSTTPLDADGVDVPGEGDATPLPVAYVSGVRDLRGSGLPLMKINVHTLYTPLARRDCFAVLAIDEWGRERGDLANEACLDLQPLAPCPAGPLPEPNPFETNMPVPGQDCPNVGIHGGPAEQDIPEIGEEPGPEPSVDAGVGADGGVVEGDSDSGGGCSATPGAPASSGVALLLGLPLLALRRRRR